MDNQAIPLAKSANVDAHIAAFLAGVGDSAEASQGLRSLVAALESYHKAIQESRERTQERREHLRLIRMAWHNIQYQGQRMLDDLDEIRERGGRLPSLDLEQFRTLAEIVVECRRSLQPRPYLPWIDLLQALRALTASDANPVLLAAGEPGTEDGSSQERRDSQIPEKKSPEEQSPKELSPLEKFQKATHEAIRFPHDVFARVLQGAAIASIQNDLRTTGNVTPTGSFEAPLAVFKGQALTGRLERKNTAIRGRGFGLYTPRDRAMILETDLVKGHFEASASLTVGPASSLTRKAIDFWSKVVSEIDKRLFPKDKAKSPVEGRKSTIVQEVHRRNCLPWTSPGK